MFVVPHDKFIGDACFDSYEIGHYRDSEGYVETWIDKENDCTDNCTTSYTFSGIDSTSSDIYFTVETYGHSIIPLACTTGKYSLQELGTTVNYPVVKFEIYKGNVKQKEIYYVDDTHKPLLIANTNHAVNDAYTIMVKYEWIGSPHRDYTLKAYSKFTNAKISDAYGNTNKLNMDGQSPRGFTSSSYEGITADCSKWGIGVATAVKDTIVKSLFDVFGKANGIGEFFEYLWYNPWIIFIWFTLW